MKLFEKYLIDEAEKAEVDLHKELAQNIGDGLYSTEQTNYFYTAFIKAYIEAQKRYRMPYPNELNQL